MTDCDPGIHRYVNHLGQEVDKDGKPVKSDSPCQECGHNKHVHVNWVGSCAVYNNGKRCKCGVYRDTGLTFSISQEAIDPYRPDPVQQTIRRAQKEQERDWLLKEHAILADRCGRDVADLWYPEVAGLGDSAKSPITIKSYDSENTGDQWSGDQWLRYRLSDLKAQIAREEVRGTNTGLLHAAKRMVQHLEGQINVQDYPKPEPGQCRKCGGKAVDPQGDLCWNCGWPWGWGTAGEALVADTVSIIMCDQCPTSHPKAFCPKKKTTGQEDDMGKKKDTSEKREWVQDTLHDLTARMDERERAARNLLSSLEATDREVARLRGLIETQDSELDGYVETQDADRRLIRELRTDHDLMRDFVHRANVEREDQIKNLTCELNVQRQCNDMLRETVEKLADNQEKLLEMLETGKSVAKTHTLWLDRLSKRVRDLEDRLDPPSPDESLEYRIVQQDDSEPHGLDSDGHCADCDENTTPESAESDVVESRQNCNQFSNKTLMERLVLAAVEALADSDPVLLIGIGENEIRLTWEPTR